MMVRGKVVDHKTDRDVRKRTGIAIAVFVEVSIRQQMAGI